MARLESGRQTFKRMGMMESGRERTRVEQRVELVGRQRGSLPVLYDSASRTQFPRIPRVEHEDDYPLNEADVDPNWSLGRVKRENKRQQRKREDDFNDYEDDFDY